MYLIIYMYRRHMQQLRFILGVFPMSQRAEKSTKSVPRAADILLRQGRLRAEAYRQKGGSQPTIGKIMTLNPIRTRSHRFTVGQHSQYTRTQYFQERETLVHFCFHSLPEPSLCPNVCRLIELIFMDMDFTFNLG